MIFRNETRGDEAAIHALTASAFAGKAYSDGTEADLIDALRREGALTFSHLAVQEGRIVGHVALSAVEIARLDKWFGLGPISVAPELQGNGIGSQLMQAALLHLKTIGAHGCALVGDPNYYRRFGFQSGALSYGGLPSDYVMHLGVQGPEPKGPVRFHPAFGSH